MKKFQMVEALSSLIDSSLFESSIDMHRVGYFFFRINLNNYEQIFQRFLKIEEEVEKFSGMIFFK